MQYSDRNDYRKDDYYRGNNDYEYSSYDRFSDDFSEKQKEFNAKRANTIEPNANDRNIPIATIVKFIVFIAIIAVLCLGVFYLWPHISDAFSEGGVNALIDSAKNAGWLGALLLLFMQIAQVIVAIIPGEATQLAAGLMYGPVGGSAIVIFGTIIASLLVYALVSKLGMPFVKSFVSPSGLKKLASFSNSNKLNTIVFIWFLIPGLPKDVVTYIMPLTTMKMSQFLIISTIARCPGIITSVYAADALASGDYMKAIIVFAVLAVIAVIAIIAEKRISKFLTN